MSPGRVENGRTRIEPEKYTTTYNHTDLQTEEASFLIFLTLGSLPEILRGIRKEQVSLKLVELILPTLFFIVQIISLRRYFQKFGWYKSIVCFIRLYWVLIPLRIHSRLKKTRKRRGRKRECSIVDNSYSEALRLSPYAYS